MAGLFPRSSIRQTTRTEEEVLALLNAPRDEYIPAELFEPTYTVGSITPEAASTILSIPGPETPTPDSIADDLNALLLPRTESTAELQQAVAEGGGVENPHTFVTPTEESSPYEPYVRLPEESTVTPEAAATYLTVLGEPTEAQVPHIDLPRTDTTEELQAEVEAGGGPENPRDDVLDYDIEPGPYDPYLRYPEGGSVDEEAAGKYLTILDEEYVEPGERASVRARKRRPRFIRKRKTAADVLGPRGTLALGARTKGASLLGAGAPGKKRKLGE